MRHYIYAQHSPLSDSTRSLLAFTALLSAPAASTRYENMTPPPRRKRGRHATTEDFEYTTSDLEEDRQPVTYVVEKLSKDRRRIIREEGQVRVSSDTEGQSSKDDDESRVNDLPEYSWDLGNMDVEGLTQGGRVRGMKDSKKRRYISAVCYSIPHAFLCCWLITHLVFVVLGPPSAKLDPSAR